MDKIDNLYKAIEIVEKSTYSSDIKSSIIQTLQSCIRKTRAKKWSQENIFAACDVLVKTHGELLASHLGVGNAPSIAVIRNAFKMSFRDFRAKYYPLPTEMDTRSPYHSKNVEEWTANFICQYNTLKPQTQTEYNTLRDKSTPTWNTIAKMNNCTSWCALLTKLSLPVYRTNNLQLNVASTFESQKKLTELFPDEKE